MRNLFLPSSLLRTVSPASRFLFLPLYHHPLSLFLCLWTLFSLLIRFTCLGRFATDTFISRSSPPFIFQFADLQTHRTITRVWRRPPGWIVAVRRHAVLVILPWPPRWTLPPPLPPLLFPSFFSPLLCLTDSSVQATLYSLAGHLWHSPARSNCPRETTSVSSGFTFGTAPVLALGDHLSLRC